MTPVKIYLILISVLLLREGALCDSTQNIVFQEKSNEISKIYNETYKDNEFAFDLTCKFTEALFLREGYIYDNFISTLFTLVNTVVKENDNFVELAKQTVVELAKETVVEKAKEIKL